MTKRTVPAYVQFGCDHGADDIVCIGASVSSKHNHKHFRVIKQSSH